MHYYIRYLDRDIYIIITYLLLHPLDQTAGSWYIWYLDRDCVCACVRACVRVRVCVLYTHGLETIIVYTSRILVDTLVFFIC